MLKRLQQAQESGKCPQSADDGERKAKRRKPLESRQRDQPLPPTAVPSDARTAPYPRNLTPMPSLLRPHCRAGERLLKWVPFESPRAPGEGSLSDAERERVKETMVRAWEEETRTSYGAGLLMWHCFCDGKGVEERERAPAQQSLISAFVAHMATAYSGKTIAGYLSGVRAWHLLHSVPWTPEKKELDVMLRAAEKLTPITSRRKKRLPYTPAFISAVRQHLNLELPLDAAVYACLTTCFYASARLGEFTVRTQTSFNQNKHVTTQNLAYEQDRNGLKVTTLHLPSTKVASSEGEDVYWATQDGDTDPTAALQNHLLINQPPGIGHLFAYRIKNARCPLTKTSFSRRLTKLRVPRGLSRCRVMASGSDPPSSTC